MKKKRVYRYDYSYERYFDCDELQEGVIHLDVIGDLHPEAVFRCMINFLEDHFVNFTLPDAVDIAKSLLNEVSDDEE